MIYIFSDNIETGKSTTLFNWTKGRKDVYGVLTPRNDKGHRYMLNVKTKKITPLQAKSMDMQTIAVGRYHFLKSAFEIANTIITNAAYEEKNGYIIIDELGKLELIS
ncbi:nucleoside-triphosphatase, partial [Winogradskyella sp.]|uniref:nucleoside-triphosphatase n=1 Tax=Winogradskyella sp. TaxID=1883156 RepID=UPI003F6D4C63